MAKNALPKVVWMEVDTQNKELPLHIADSSRALAKMCGTTENNVRITAWHQKRTGETRRFVRVELVED